MKDFIRYNLHLRFYLEINCSAAGKVAGTCGCFAMYLSLPMPLHWVSVLGGQSYVDRSSGVQLRGENGMNECLMKDVLGSASGPDEPLQRPF